MNVKSKPTNKAIKSDYISKFKTQWKDIDILHSGKATDELGLAAEHFKNSPTTVTHFLTNCFNNIFNNHHIPDIFKSGIVTPVLKKGKNPMLMDNYRGIAVTPVISKLFECTILPRLTVNFNQSPLQFGFTKGLSMLMASFIITEARTEVKLVTMEPLFLITVDSQKAFDVVDHIILLDALYDHTQNHPLWSIVKNLYSGLVSRVKWKGTISDSFNIHQGVRQGGILSPFLYKVYVNNLLEDLKSHNLGLKIGTNYVGCPTCADDIAFLSSSHQELQCMLSVATHHARQSRVTINPTKTKAVILNKPKNINRSDLNWTLGNTPVYPSEDTTHLGLIRAELKENNLNVDARISIARRTLYSLMNTGLHGTNGLNPQTSYKIYQSYVIPQHNIQFGNVHRFGKNSRNGPKRIVARFIYRDDLQHVLEKAYRLKGTQYGIKEQFPQEIENRRRKLYPVMKEAKRGGNRVALVRDKLFINNELYISEENAFTSDPVNNMNTPVITQQHTDRRLYSQVTHQTPSRQTNGRPNKRPRAGSSPTDNSGE
ncbi:unnamed protein product [Mytilus coruscus]|uniref:Reverse transcriptase domain-containing protein n=1 Tax=Mytilus coruscus TaxID=42192 RepID=A0A6J8EPF6_MYTCO|nr:unnamed protein product [Mytilus coruscus]